MCRRSEAPARPVTRLAAGGSEEVPLHLLGFLSSGRRGCLPVHLWWAAYLRDCSYSGLAERLSPPVLVASADVHLRVIVVKREELEPGLRKEEAGLTSVPAGLVDSFLVWLCTFSLRFSSLSPLLSLHLCVPVLSFLPVCCP